MAVSPYSPRRVMEKFMPSPFAWPSNDGAYHTNRVGFSRASALATLAAHGSHGAAQGCKLFAHSKFARRGTRPGPRRLRARAGRRRGNWSLPHRAARARTTDAVSEFGGPSPRDAPVVSS